MVYGNTENIPLAGGSGGAGGNPYFSLSGFGGGGGGAIAMYSGTTATCPALTADGGPGGNDSAVTTHGNTNSGGIGYSGSGGGGSGGAIVLGAKNILNLTAAFSVRGGPGGTTTNPSKAGSFYQALQSGGAGGAGRVRLDGTGGGSAVVLGTGATLFTGPTTADSTFVPRTFNLTGTGNGTINIYVRPLSGTWSLAATVLSSGSLWSTPITLAGTDTMYLLAAAQKVPSPSATQYTAEPSWVLSQAAANILRTTCVPPVASISPSMVMPICAGDTVTLTASPSGLQYQWLKNGQPQGVNAASFTVSDSGLYRVIVTNGSGCSDSTSVQVTVSPLPVAAITAQDTLICSGSSTTLTASGGATYLWSDGEKTPAISVSQAGSYSVIVTNTAGCSTSAGPVSVALRPVPNYVLSAPPDSTICVDSGKSYTRWIAVQNKLAVGDTLYLQRTGGAQYTPQFDTLRLGPGETDSIPITLTTDGLTGTYSGTYSIADSCGNGTQTLTLNVTAARQNLLYSLQPDTPDTMKIGVPRSVKVFLNPPSLLSQLATAGPISFTLKNDPTALVPGNLAVSSPCATSTLTSYARDSVLITLDACPSLLTNPVATITYNTLAGSTLNPQVLLTGSLVNDCFTLQADPLGDTIVTLSLDPVGCEIPTVVNVTNFIAAIVSVTPNPSTEAVSVEYEVVEEAPVSIVLYNLLGQPVRTILSGSQKAGEYTVEATTSDLPTGMYYLHFTAGSAMDGRHLLIEH